MVFGLESTQSIPSLTSVNYSNISNVKKHESGKAHAVSILQKSMQLCATGQYCVTTIQAAARALVQNADA